MTTARRNQSECYVTKLILENQCVFYFCVVLLSPALAWSINFLEHKLHSPHRDRCNMLKCPRLDCPPACKFPISIITTPYRFIPWPLWPMLKHWMPDNLARGHLSLVHRLSLLHRFSCTPPTSLCHVCASGAWLSIGGDYFCASKNTLLLWFITFWFT